MDISRMHAEQNARLIARSDEKDAFQAEIDVDTYQWFKGTTAITNANSSTYTITSPGDATVGTFNYTVQVGLQIKPACASTTSNGITVNVNDIPGTPTITITP